MLFAYRAGCRLQGLARSRRRSSSNACAARRMNLIYRFAINKYRANVDLASLRHAGYRKRVNSVVRVHSAAHNSRDQGFFPRFTRGRIESNAPSELTRAERIGYEVRPLARSERNSFISRKVERVKMAVSCRELGGFKSTIPRGINGGERILRYIRRETVPRRVRGTLAHGKCGK